MYKPVVPASATTTHSHIQTRPVRYRLPGPEQRTKTLAIRTWRSSGLVSSGSPSIISVRLTTTLTTSERSSTVGTASRSSLDSGDFVQSVHWRPSVPPHRTLRVPGITGLASPSGRCPYGHPEEGAEKAYGFSAAWFAGSTVLTLLLSGDKSAPFLTDVTDVLNDALPNSRPAIFAGYSHATMYTAPERFIDEVLAFLHESS